MLNVSDYTIIESALRQDIWRMERAIEEETREEAIEALKKLIRLSKNTLEKIEKRG